MKTKLLLLTLFLASGLYTFAQDRIIADFEGGDTVFFVSGTAMPASIVDNPDKSGINTSDKVLKVIAKGTFSENLAVTLNPALNFYTHPELSFKIYSTDTIGIAARFDQADRWQQMLFTTEFPLNKTASVTTQGDSMGVWVEFTFDMSMWDNISGYEVLKILATDISKSADSILYIDDVKMIERSPAFDANTIVPIFYDPVTVVKWVGNWAGGIPQSQNQYGIVKNGFTMSDEDTVLLSPNGYMAWPNDTIAGSSGGAAYVLLGAGADSVLYLDNGRKYMKNYTPTLSFPEIPTAGVRELSLKFDMAVLGKGYQADMQPVVEVKFSDSAEWEPALVLSNIPAADSTWTTVTAAIAGGSKYTTVRFTNDIPCDDDTMQFWIDDVTLLGKVTLANTLNIKGEDDLSTVSVDGKLQLIAEVTPEGASNVVEWGVNDTLATVDSKGLVSGVDAGTLKVFATTIDGTNLSDTLVITVQAEPILATEIIINAPLTTVEALQYFMPLTATVKPANTTDKTVTWSSGTPAVATINSVSGVLRSISDGVVTITATASDGSGTTGTIDITVDATSGIDGNALDKFTIYPNPVIDNLIIENASQIVTVKIFNTLGSIVLEQMNGDEQMNINTSELIKGIYVLQITTREGANYSARIQKN